MQKSAKHFSEQLNKCLDDLGMPAGIRERAILLSKMLNIPKQQAWGLLEGHILPDELTLKQITTELEVDNSYFYK